MNAEMRSKLGISHNKAVGKQLEELLTVGSKIFFQTHIYPIIKMQNFAREIYLTFNGSEGAIPTLLNVETRQTGSSFEIHCGGMEISKRHRFEKEILEAKKAAEDALAENFELTKLKEELIQNQQMLEVQYRKLNSLKEQQQELFKLITHDLQEPLRKAFFFSAYILSEDNTLTAGTAERLKSIKQFSFDMRQILLTLQRFQELGETTLSFSNVCISSAISAAISQLRIASEEDIKISFKSTDHMILGDLKLLTNLFVELLDTSRKNRNESLSKLQIDIAISETEKNVFLESRDKYLYQRFIKVTYIDNGLGFRTDSDKVFKIIQKSVQFNQISMGLAFAKRIVEKHSGNIIVKSVKGRGLGYTILFPKSPK